MSALKLTLASKWAGRLFILSPSHPLTLSLCLLLALLLPQPARAQEGDNRAGLVIVHGDGRVVQQCVAFAEESITGYELLQRAGAALNIEAGGFGATVCSINGEGCSYPAETCFCRCQGSPCVYWSYWQLQPEGGWRYRPLGASNTQVRNGDVDGWQWAAGTREKIAEPPAVSFADICAPQAQAATDVTEITEAVETHGAAQSATETVTEQAMETPAATPTGAPGAAAEPVAAGAGVEQVGVGVDSLWAVPAAAVILPAAVIVIWALVRRRR